jgi:hypothetical protein
MSAATAEPPVWSPEEATRTGTPDAAQQRRGTARQIELFRGRYNVSETAARPVPERFGEEDTGRQLHEQAVTVSKRSQQPATG